MQMRMIRISRGRKNRAKLHKNNIGENTYKIFLDTGRKIVL